MELGKWKSESRVVPFAAWRQMAESLLAKRWRFPFAIDGNFVYPLYR